MVAETLLCLLFSSPAALQNSYVAGFLHASRDHRIEVISISHPNDSIEVWAKIPTRELPQCPDNAPNCTLGIPGVNFCPGTYF